MMTPISIFATALAVLPVPSQQGGGPSQLGGGPSQQGGGTVLIEARRIVVAPDTVLENQRLLVRDGVIAGVGSEIPDEATRGVRRVEYAGTVVPGFVNPHTHLGQSADLAERISALTPDLRAADAFDPFDESLLLSARHGVTTLCLAPLSTNTFAGMAAVVKAGEVGAMVADTAYLKLALVDESFDQQRYPTSRMGAAELIRQSFAAARVDLGSGDPVTRALRAATTGATRIAIHARNHASITAALDLCQEMGATPLLIGADEADRSIARIAALGGSVMLGPLRTDAVLRQLQLPGKLAAAGIPFSFTAEHGPAPAAAEAPVQIPGLPPGVVVFRGRGSRTPPPPPKTAHPEALRTSAALAVRYGASRRAALAALTRTPALQCGVQARCGTLREGRDADFAVFDGDPLDLGSRLLAVYVGGQRIQTDATESTR